MLDFGVHPPTTKWPEMVPEAMLTEPTEIENKSSLDDLASAFNLAYSDVEEALENAPNRTAASRIDQVGAARNPRLSWQALDEE
jgi:glycine dehydrogenase subunit 2